MFPSSRWSSALGAPRFPTPWCPTCSHCPGTRWPIPGRTVRPCCSRRATAPDTTQRGTPPPWSWTCMRGSCPPAGVGQLVAGVGDPRPDIGHAAAPGSRPGWPARVAAARESTGLIVRWGRTGDLPAAGRRPGRRGGQRAARRPSGRLLDEPDPTPASTVVAYLDRAGNVAQTAADLHIHRQTLYSRLAKAERLTAWTFGRDATGSGCTWGCYWPHCWDRIDRGPAHKATGLHDC